MPQTRHYRELHEQVMARPGAEERLSKLRQELLAKHGLAAIRTAEGVSQRLLAGRIHVSQPRLSQVERSGDIRLSTLRSYLAGLGAEVEITAVFSDGRRVLVEVSADEQPQECCPSVGARAGGQPTRTAADAGRSPATCGDATRPGRVVEVANWLGLAAPGLAAPGVGQARPKTGCDPCV